MKKVSLFLANGFEVCEVITFIDVFEWSREHGIEPVDLTNTGLREKIKCIWNITVIHET